VFYLLLQVAHTIAQLIEYGSLFRKAFPAGVGLAKNIAFRLFRSLAQPASATGTTSANALCTSFTAPALVHELSVARL